MLTVALTLAVAPVGRADTADQKRHVDANITALSAARDGTTVDLAKAMAELERTKADLPGLQQALTAAQTAQAVADQANVGLAAEIVTATANEAAAIEVLAQNARDSQAVQDQVGNLARTDYQRGPISGLAVALEASSPADFTDRIVMMNTVMGVRRGALRGLDELRAQGLAAKARLSAVRRQVARLKIQAEISLGKATVARDAAVAAKTKLNALIAAKTTVEASIAAKQAVQNANLAQLQAQSDSLARTLKAHAAAVRAAAARAAARAAASKSPSRPANASTSAPGNSGGFLSYPVDAPVSSEFGFRWGRPHQGIDFAANCGAPVYAAAGGDVILTAPEAASGGYGNMMVIDHGIQRGVDLTTTYNHLTSWVVTSGHVSRGQLVAIAGTTGDSTGCHLHFETRQDGTPVNPRYWF